MRAKELEQQSEEKLNELNERLQKVRGELNDKRMNVRAELLANYNETIYQARQEADKEIKENAAKILADQDLVREELKEKAREVANTIATRTLGRSVS